jgi:hypothetical protein
MLTPDMSTCLVVALSDCRTVGKFTYPPKLKNSIDPSRRCCLVVM